MKVIAELEGQDYLAADSEDTKYLKAIGCSTLLTLIRSCKEKYGEDLAKWPLPEGNHHTELLVRELLQKQRGQWNFPYPHTELCHCRAVTTHSVDQAIVAGARTPEQVSRLTMASTACGTCRPEVEKILEYRCGL